MKKSLLIFLIFSISSLHSIAQYSAPPIQWGTDLGGSLDDVARSVKQTTNDGGYIIAGYSNSHDGEVTNNHGVYDYWVMKLSSSGDTMWTKTYGGTANDKAYSVQQTTDGGYIVAGASNSSNLDVTGNHLGYDFWIVKLDGNGNIMWETSLGGGGDDYAYAIQQTFDGGYIAVGQTNSVNGNVTGNHGAIDVWVVKIGASGDLQYQKCLGGTGNDYGYSIEQTADSGFIVAGNTASNNSGEVGSNHGDNDAWIVKLGSINDSDSLALQWQVCLGGSLYDYAQSVQQTIDGGYIVAGYSNSTDGDLSTVANQGLNDCWIIKLNSTGNIEWQKLYGGPGTDEAYYIQQTADSGYVFLGYSNSISGNIAGNHGGYDYWMVKLDQSGDSSWQKALGGSNDDYGYAIQQTGDMGFVVAGSTSSNDGDLYNKGYRGQNDFWVAKLDREVGIAEKNNSVAAFGVYPNPVSSRTCGTTVSFSLTQPESVNIKIYDVMGRAIKTLNHSTLTAGIHTFNWSADNDAGNSVDNGIYILTIETPDGSQTKSVAVVK